MVYNIAINNNTKRSSGKPPCTTYKNTPKREKTLEFFIDNIFIKFSGRVFQQAVSIPMGTNCTPVFANLFMLEEEEFVQEENEKKLACYIDEALSLNNL